MALAIVEFMETGPRGPRLRIDIGKNAYYSYAVGGNETTQQNGVEMLLDPVFTSPVLGPLPPSSRGRAFVDVAGDLFDREHRRVQIASFRARNGTGPAISDIADMPYAGTQLEDLPPPAFITEGEGGRRPPGSRSFTYAAGANMTSHNAIVENVPYSYQRGQAYSSGMFLEAITSILPQVLPSLGSLFGGLFKPGGGATNGNAAGLPAGLLGVLGNPETIKLLTELAKQISGAKSVGTALTYSNAASHQAAVHALSRYRHEFSEAKVAPALLAALPALMPIIEKVLNPETMKAIMENISPAKLMGTVTDAIGNFAKIGLEDRKQLQEHLERLNPGVKNAELYQLLESLGTGEVRSGSKLKYKRVESVKLAFAEITPQTIYGRSRLAYLYGQDLAFPLDVETPKPIRQATLEVCLKEAGTLKVVYERTQRVSDVSSGRLESMPAVPWSALSTVRPGDDYLLAITLCWNGKDRSAKRGTSISQMITLVSEYAFDRVEESSPDMVALNDPERDRDFWHRLWEQTFEDRGLTRVRLACDYCYVLEGHRNGNARMDTKARVAADAESRRHEGKVKSGMILSPDALNRLIPRVSADSDPPLSDAQLDALRTPDFVDRFNQAAKTQVEFKGRRGESAALWVYPEMKLREVVLKRAGNVNEHGHVQAFEEETVKFPMPALVHFVGASTAS